jgi:hypothetical protein
VTFWESWSVVKAVDHEMVPEDEHKRRGDGGHEHTEKAERMAEQIEEGEEKKGESPRRAEEIAWRTVHKDLPHDEREEKEG